MAEDQAHHSTGEHPAAEKKARFYEGFGPFAIGLFVLSLLFLFMLPKWQPAPATLSFVEGKVLQASQGQTIVEMTLEWSAPSAGNCYLANDVRPAGAAKGEPETAEWTQNHLIRYALRSGQPFVEYWINAEVLDARTGTRTYTYIIENPPAGTTQLDLYSELKCDDALLTSAKKTVEYSAAK